MADHTGKQSTQDGGLGIVVLSHQHYFWRWFGLVVMALITSTVGSDVGELSRVCRLCIQPATQAGQLSLLPAAEWEQYSIGERAVAVVCGWDDN